jgi:hypothetical protein
MRIIGCYYDTCLELSLNIRNYFIFLITLRESDTFSIISIINVNSERCYRPYDLHYLLDARSTIHLRCCSPGLFISLVHCAISTLMQPYSKISDPTQQGGNSTPCQVNLCHSKL